MLLLTEMFNNTFSPRGEDKCVPVLECLNAETCTLVIVSKDVE